MPVDAWPPGPSEVVVAPAANAAPGDEHADIAGLDALERSDAPALGRGRCLWRDSWPKVTAVALALLLWQGVVWSGWREEYLLPGPSSVLPRLWGQIRTGDFWEAVATTMRRAAVGFGLSVGIGSAVGAIVSRNRLVRSAVGSFITGLQTMPSITWFPLAILLFQLSENAILFVVVLGAAPSIANGLVSGVDHVPPILVRAGRVLGARRWTLFRSVILPAAMPSFLGGLKQGWAFAWRSLMAGELLVIIANRPSLGARLDFARQFSDAELMLALMIAVLVIGIVVDALFGVAERRIRSRRGLLVES